MSHKKYHTNANISIIIIIIYFLVEKNIILLKNNTTSDPFLVGKKHYIVKWYNYYSMLKIILETRKINIHIILFDAPWINNIMFNL
jgi:hypothetical protein